MKANMLIALSSLPFFLLSACTCNNGSNDPNLPDTIAENKLPAINVEIQRYEKALFDLNMDSLQAGLKRIQPEFSVFLEGDLDDKNNVEQLRAYLKDDVIRKNFEECMKQYPDLNELDRNLSVSFSYYKYYFPEWRVPQVYTYVSGGDFNAPIKNADSALIVALDIYLGAGFPLYAQYGVPAYKSQFMDRKYIVRDCMEELGIQACSYENYEPTFLDQMINLGKVMYFMDVMMPGTPDSIKMKYSNVHLVWCSDNEANIWSFFIDNKLLYSKDHQTFLKFFSDGPFTSGFGKKSPPRIAIWTGWQIVRAYMKNSKDIDIHQLIAEKDAQKILEVSKYKPKK